MCVSDFLNIIIYKNKVGKEENLQSEGDREQGKFDSCLSAFAFLPDGRGGQTTYPYW